MKTSSLWIIRIALTVQFIGVLAVPALVASAESPRATWMAEWVKPQSPERTIGVLKLRDGRLSFDEQVGQASWALELSALKRVVISNGGRALTIESSAGDRFTVAILEPNMTLGSPKRVLATIDRALQIAGASVTTSSR